MSRRRLLDLFCGAGGAAMGYLRAGFEVVGVDINPQPDYPCDVVEANLSDLRVEDGWLSFGGIYLRLSRFDAIHASPPCQRYSTMTASPLEHPDLYAPTRAVLVASGLPFVIENVIGAPYSHGVVLCGSMFGLKVRRHRNFETSWLVWQPECQHGSERPYTITGDGGACDRPHSLKPAARDFWRYLDMPWMEGKPPYGVAQAIPPAYTEWIGERLLADLEAKP